MAEMDPKQALGAVRVEIDRVDGEIKKLFRQRMKLADQVAKIKAGTGDDIFKPDREAAIISRLTEDVDPSIRKEYTAVIRRIMELSRKYQYGRTLELRDCLNIDYQTTRIPVNRVAVPDTEAEICKKALDMERAGAEEDIEPTINTVQYYGALCELVLSGTVDCGMGIMEEIGIGVSDDLHRILVENPLYINRCHIVKDGQIRKKVVFFTPTLTADPEDNRIKLSFVCPNRSGSLGSILSMIADYGVNLTEIHSKPDRHREWNYIFMLEMDANFLEKETKALLFQLRSETEDFRILGSYRVEE